MGKKEELTEADKSWLACAIDGEGSIVLSRFGTAYVYPDVRICNTNPKFVEHASALMKRAVGVRGVNIWCEERQKPNNNLWVVRVMTRKAQALLGILLPYLIIKRRKAVEMLLRRIMTPKEIGQRVASKATRDSQGRFAKKVG